MLLTLTGASAVGKTSIMKRLLSERGNTHLLPSFTTREPRQGDAEGEYTYLTQEEFRVHSITGEFAWQMEFSNASYGTRHADLSFALASYDVFLAAIVPGHIPIIHEFAAVQGFTDRLRSIFIISPGRRILAKRMVELRGESPAVADRKIAACSSWDRDTERSRYYSFVQDRDVFEEKYREVVDILDRPW